MANMTKIYYIFDVFSSMYSAKHPNLRQEGLGAVCDCTVPRQLMNDPSTHNCDVFLVVNASASGRAIKGNVNIED